MGSNVVVKETRPVSSGPRQLWLLNDPAHGWLAMALPIGASAAACVTLIVTSAIVGFACAVGTAFAWCWWLARGFAPRIQAFRRDRKRQNRSHPLET